MYSKDDANAYYARDPIDGADVKTFEPLKGGYAKDRNFAYYKGKRIEGVKVKHFKYYGSNPYDTNVDGIYGTDEYATDGKNVYCNGKKLEGCHAPSFRLTLRDLREISVHKYYAEDRNNIYGCNGSVKSKK